MTTRGVRNLSLLVLAGALLTLGTRLTYVHAHTWEWSLTPSATAPKLDFVERTYLRGVEQRAAPEGWTVRGRTVGGGAILAPDPSAYAPTVVVVRDAGRLTAYSLSGGP
jgi:hypothetical protein